LTQLKCTLFHGNWACFEKGVTGTKSGWLRGQKSLPYTVGDMECKAHQILVNIFDKDDNNFLSKSMTEVIVKANEVISKMEDADKPAKIRVEAALQTCKKVLVLTLNSKEAAKWIKQPENEMTFTEAFLKGLHIRERTYNLIVPRIPIIFKLDNKNHLREIEEVNGLGEYTIHKARWIKPTVRRRVGQTHTYTILTITSADHANMLIRDGLIICSTRVRPTKQKFEPIQCIKCRKWSHFVGECLANKDTCSTCGG